MASEKKTQHLSPDPGSDPGNKRIHPAPQAGSTRTGRKMLYLLLGLSACICIFMFLIYPVVRSGSDEEITIKIPAGATSQSVRDTLTKYYGDSFTANVIRLASLRGVDLSTRHGAYKMPPGASAFSVARQLTSWGQTPVRITINGFRDMPHMIELISRKMEFPEDSLRAALNDSVLLAEYGVTPRNAMAIFMDNTYEAYWTASARDLVRKIGDNYSYFWNPARQRAAADLGLTPAEIMTLASIVDEETNLESEKGTIGRLYLNRLRNNMKLQADPTVRFAIGNFTIQRISHNDLKYESPYNTYLHPGLPPGPIRTTSECTVDEIMKSEPNNYLYMCAKEDFSGGHNFSASYNEHLQNAARYQAALDRQGITRK